MFMERLSGQPAQGPVLIMREDGAATSRGPEAI